MAASARPNPTACTRFTRSPRKAAARAMVTTGYRAVSDTAVAAVPPSLAAVHGGQRRARGVRAAAARPHPYVSPPARPAPTPPPPPDGGRQRLSGSSPPFPPVLLLVIRRLPRAPLFLYPTVFG